MAASKIATVGQFGRATGFFLFKKFLLALFLPEQIEEVDLLLLLALEDVGSLLTVDETHGGVQDDALDDE